MDGPLFYANATKTEEHLLALVEEADEPPDVVVLELDQSDIDVESLDMLAELADALEAESAELRLAAVRERVYELLRRRGLAQRVRIDPTLDAAAAVEAAGKEPRWRTR